MSGYYCKLCKREATHYCAGIDTPIRYFCESCALTHRKVCPICIGKREQEALMIERLSKNIGRDIRKHVRR